jgi:hypothetical protein
VGAKDGLLVAHFPIELEITVSAKDSGNAVMRFPSLFDAEKDSYEFIQLPNVPVRELVNVISGGEDIDIGIPPEEVFWGVRVFSAPQQQVDVTTGELIWQAPWTRLAAADFYHLRFWENAERARREAREDVEPYVRGLGHYYAAHDERTALENIDEVRTEIGERDVVVEELDDSTLSVMLTEGRFATLPEQASFSFS